MEYNWIEAKEWESQWIKNCATCIDKNSNFMITKKCMECIRNPYAICGDGKIDWYNHFTDKIGRIEKENKYNEEKKRKFLESQKQRKKNTENKI